LGFASVSRRVVGGCSTTCTKAADCVRSKGCVRSHVRSTPEIRPKLNRSPGFSLNSAVVPSRLSSAAITALRSEEAACRGAGVDGAADRSAASVLVWARAGAARGKTVAKADRVIRRRMLLTLPRRRALAWPALRCRCD
jgi:hypothetical protein